MKFGGTSVKDVEARAPRRRGSSGRERRPRLVVVSALSSVTDALLEVARLAETGRRGRRRARRCGRFTGGTRRWRRLVRATERRAGLLAAIDALFDELEGDRPRARGRRGGLAALLRRDRGVRRAGEQPHRGRGARGRGPREPLARRAGRARDRTPSTARPSPTARRPTSASARSCARSSPTGSCRWSAASWARPRRGLTTTLGRGGSDYSAALFGAGLGRRRDPDLDRRRRHAHRRPADGRGAPGRPAAQLRRGLRARLLRRQGPAPEPRSCPRWASASPCAS